MIYKNFEDDFPKICICAIIFVPLYQKHKKQKQYEIY